MQNRFKPDQRLAGPSTYEVIDRGRRFIKISFFGFFPLLYYEGRVLKCRKLNQNCHPWISNFYFLNNPETGFKDTVYVFLHSINLNNLS